MSTELKLPLDYPRPPGSARQLAVHSLDLAAIGNTPLRPELLVAAYAAQLARYSGQESVPVLIATVSGSEGAPRRRVLDLPTAADTRCGYLLDHLRLQLATTGSDTDDKILDGADHPAAVLFMRGAAALPLDHAAALRCDLCLLVCSDAPGISFIYNAESFKPATVERFASHFARLLAEFLLVPGRLVDELPMLGDREIDWLNGCGSGPQRPAAGVPLHRLIERQAAQRPEAVAVRYRDQQLDYAQLDRRANRLANYLLSIGVTSGSRVVVCVDPGLDIHVCLLAVLKAGATYVPLDPGYPAARIRTILEDVRPHAALTLTAHADKLAMGDIHVCAVDTDAPRIRNMPEQRPDVPIAPELPAYVFYTSGTTGKPKGILANHRNLAHYVTVARDRYGLTASDVMPAIARFSFSISLFELLTPLIVGGTVVVLDRDHVLDLARLARTMEAATIFHAGPSLLKNVVAHIRSHYRDFLPFAGVRHASSGGDLIPPELLESLKEIFGNAEVYVIYGCSEVSVMGCTWFVPRDRTVKRTYVGRPFDNLRIRVLDSKRQPTATGIVGEVYFSGDGVVGGYLDRPELTQERFLILDGQRFYNTGDVGRICDEGWLELLGRRDFQVQIRGMRVELGEIEYALRRIPGVKDGVVVARNGNDGEKVLVAYYVPEDSHTIDSPAQAQQLKSVLRAQLGSALPDYMVPVLYAPLQALPLNNNMKVDRNALPAVEEVLSRGRDARELRAPSTPAQERVARIWCDVLGSEAIGIDDDFFELGGHSLLIMQVLSRIRAEFATDLALRTLFDTPTVAGVAAAVEAKQALNEGSVATVIDRLSAAKRHGLLPLSAAQERMWFWNELAPGTPLYNVPIALTLKGELRTDALASSLRKLALRHEILRSRWLLSGGQPMQQIQQQAEWPIRHERLDALPEVEADRRYQALAAEEVLHAFDLVSEPACRALLVTLCPGQHRLILTLHHSVCDGWSTGILINDLWKLYSAEVVGVAAPLTEPALHYVDFAAWEPIWLNGGVREQELAYWKRQLADAPQSIDLTVDHRRPAVQRFRGGIVPILLNAERLASLKALGHRTNTTLFMTLLAAWQSLLYRYSGQETVVTGSVIANRDRSELEGVVGYFANSLALRADFRAGMTVKELLAQVRTTALGAYDNQHVPFEEVVEALKLPRDARRMPLIQTFLELQPPAEVLHPAGGVAIERTSIPTPVAKFDLSLELLETGTTLEGYFEYDADLFEQATIERLAGHFQLLIDAMCRDEQQQVDRLPLMTADELRQSIVSWNDTTVDYEYDLPVHHHVERQVQASPDAVAVQLDDQVLTYSGLNTRANQLAHFLRSVGVGPDIAVGVCMERSLELVVSILAIGKSGGTYVPLDPEYPPDRLAYMLQDSDASIVLTQRRLQALVAEAAATVPRRLLCVDDEWSTVAGHALTNPVALAGADHIAYIIYTSGSTGRPKGAAIPHRGLCNHILWMRQEFQLVPTDRLLQKTSISFDASVADFYVPLVAGAALVLARPGEHRDTGYLIRAMREQHITIVQFVPSALRVLVSEDELETCRDLRYLISGGEALDWETARAIQQCLPAAVLGNFYGPSEASDDATQLRVPSQPLETSYVPIGRPIANVQCYVLDRLMQPVPVGVVGELYIGGVGLARGYHNRPDLTAEKFVPSPFAAGKRLYRTGDLVRRRADALLDYIGRADFQVKIRGYRIELGEIEAAIAAAPKVARCAVIVREDQPGEKRLAAYVVGSAVDFDALRQRLLDQLPEYMVPAAFVALTELPTLPNGKLNTRALPPPQRRDAQRIRLAPRNASEELVVRIFREALNRDDISLKDNFFELGGHSLLAGRIMARLRSTARVSLPLRTLFERPTAEGLAAAIDALGWVSVPAPGRDSPAEVREDIEF